MAVVTVTVMVVLEKRGGGGGVEKGKEPSLTVLQ